MADEASAQTMNARIGHHQSLQRNLTFHKPDDVLFRTIKDAGCNAFGVICIELWVSSSDGQKISRPESGHWMDPMFMNTCTNPDMAKEVNDTALNCVPGESLAGTLFTETSKSWLNKRSKVHWRLISSMMNDPFLEQGRDKRMKKLHEIGIGIVATVPFRFQHRSGIVLFMSRSTVDVIQLQSKKNEDFILGATDLIGATFAIQEAREECVWMKRTRLQSAVEKVRGSLVKSGSNGQSPFTIAVLAASQSQKPGDGGVEQLVSLEEGEGNKKKLFRESSTMSKSQTRQEQLGPLRAIFTDLTQFLRTWIIKWKGAGLKAPPRQDWQESAIGLVGIFFTMLVLVKAENTIRLQSNIDGAWYASTLCIVYALTAAPVGQPSQIVFAHIWCGLVGLACRRIPLPQIVIVAMSTAFGASGMAYLGIMHPPAASISFLFAANSMNTIYSLMMVLAGDLLVIAISIVYLNLFRRKQYPTFYIGRTEKRSHDLLADKLGSLFCRREAKS